MHATAAAEEIAGVGSCSGSGCNVIIIVVVVVIVVSFVYFYVCLCVWWVVFGGRHLIEKPSILAGP